jgi:predicted metal-dependent hydrolase
VPEIHQVIRSKRKTIALVVQRDGTLIVRVPLRTPEKTIREIVTQKADWIAKAQAKMLANPPVAGTRQFVDGEKFLLMGAKYPLKVVKGQRASLTFEAGNLLLAEKARPRAREAFSLWYKRMAAMLLPGRVESLAKKHGFKPAKIRITSARTRWGSCSTSGTISLAWRLVMAPPEVIDYVIIHELAHLNVKNHSKAFWQAVAALLPDYKKHVAWLKKNGQNLDI